MKLQVGKLLSKDFAKWLNISASHLSKPGIKEEYLEILKNYADYHLEKKGNGNTIYIDAVYEDSY